MQNLVDQVLQGKLLWYEKIHKLKSYKVTKVETVPIFWSWDHKQAGLNMKNTWTWKGMEKEQQRTQSERDKNMLD